MKKISELYLEARKAFMATEDANTASLLARNLLCHITGKTQEEILASRDLYATEAQCAEMERAVQRLLRDEPIAYVLGEWDFYGLRLNVDRSVLIPRDDTCAVTALAIKKTLFLDQDPRVLDLCTGSGCIGIAIANRVKDARVTLADVSKEVLGVAKSNIQLHKLSARVSCVQVDALAEPPAFLGKFDLIVSNPPYVTALEMEQLPASVKDYEPHLALFGGEDGLDFYRSIAGRYRAVLKPGGYLCFEFGKGQGPAVSAILEQNGYKVMEITQDNQQIDRAVLAQYIRKDV